MTTLRATELKDAEQVAACITQVAGERRYLAGTAGITAEQTRTFLTILQETAGVHLVAAEGNHIVGWCDVSPLTFDGMRHVGRLGMGLLPEHRQKGLGSALLSLVLETAFQKGLQRIELEVYASNQAAIRTFQKAGFVEEGRKRRARFLDGKWDDILVMGCLKDDDGKKKNTSGQEEASWQP